MAGNIKRAMARVTDVFSLGRISLRRSVELGCAGGLAAGALSGLSWGFCS